MHRKPHIIHLIGVLFLLIVLLSQVGCLPDVPDTIDEKISIDANEDVNTLLDKFTDSHQDPDSDMQLLPDGQLSYNAFTDLINSATDHINIETLDFDDDENREENMGLEFVQMLIDKVKEGVEINIIVDPIAQKFTSRQTLVDKLRAGGVNVKYYSPPDIDGFDKMYYRTHKKMMIVDGKQAIVGGMNFGLRYLGHGQWRDTNVLLTGPVVATIQSDFLRDWQSLGGTLSGDRNYFPELGKTGDLSIRSIDQRPAQDDFDINTAVMIALRIAKHRVDIEAPYFNPTGWLVDEIEAARNRGVEIRILTNSEDSDDIPLSYIVTAYWFDDMLDLGVKIFLWDIEDRTMHSKAMVVDDKLAMVGSYNFNFRSIMWDTEDAVIFTDPQPVEAIQQMIDNDINCDCVFRVTDDWVDSHSPQERQSWDFWHLISWLF